MRRRAGRRGGRRRTGEERLLPLVNVVFLLLLVFLIAGRITPPQPFAVTPPPSTQEGAGAGAVAGARAATVAMAADGALTLDGRLMARPALLEALAARLAETPEMPVSLRVDAAADGAAMADLVGALQGVGAPTVRLGVRAATP